MDLSPVAPASAHSTEPRGARAAPPVMLLASLSQSLADRSLAALERASLATTPEKLREIFDRDASVVELACLRSCHRIEVYAVLRDGRGLGELRRSLPGPVSAWKERSGPAVAHHLFRVAAGLDSTAVGEREVRQQVLQASRSALGRGPHRLLRTLLEEAVAWTETRDTERSGEAPSIASVVASEVLRRFPHARPRTLVLGSGVVGRRVAELLRGRAEVTLLYHAHAPEAGSLATLGCRARPWSALKRELARAEVVVAAGKSKGRTLRVSDLPSPGPRHFFDLGLPRNIEPGVGRSQERELWDLQRIRQELSLPPPSAAEEEAARRGAARAFNDLRSRTFEPWLAEIWRRAEEMRAEELEGALRHAPHLDEEERIVLARMGERIVRRLLAGPTARLRRLVSGGLPPEILEALLDLYAPSD